MPYTINGKEKFGNFDKGTFTGKNDSVHYAPHKAYQMLTANKRMVRSTHSNKIKHKAGTFK